MRQSTKALLECTDLLFNDSLGSEFFSDMCVYLSYFTPDPYNTAAGYEYQAFTSENKESEQARLVVNSMKISFPIAYTILLQRYSVLIEKGKGL